MPDIRDPDSSFTGGQLQYLREVAEVIRSIPNFSYFTQDTPNGVLEANPGDRAIYIGSTSTLSREWVNAADPGGSSVSSWVQVSIVP